MGFNSITIKKLLEMTDVVRRDQVRENKFCKHNFTHSILSIDRPLKPSSGNTSNAFPCRYLNRKVKNSHMKKFIRGRKENNLLVHCNKNSNSNNPNHYLQEKYGKTEKKKRKTTKRNISRGPEPAFMLRIREEKRAIPCKKDTSIILACLSSGMKWFGEDVGE